MNQEPSKSQESEIILSAKGEPFDTERAANFSLEKKGLQETHTVIPKDEGFVIAPKATPEKPGKYVEKYYWVTFNAKTDKYQPDCVVLTCNGEVLQIKRSIKVPVPRRYLEIADHATYPEVSQRPNEQRKIVAYVTKYPYMNHGEATEKEYTEAWKSGNKATAESLKALGMTVDTI